MTRIDFHKFFKVSGPVVIPVVHVLNFKQTKENILKIIGEGASGCFLINHDFGREEFIPIVKKIREKFPLLWLAVNFLAETGEIAFPELAKLKAEGYIIDAYWADDACIDENGFNTKASRIAKIKEDSSWNGLYFGGTAFKKQRVIEEKRYKDAAINASHFMDVVTTSGVQTGCAAEINKINDFRKAISETPLALASGISLDNAFEYSNVDCFMVATGINYEGDFYQINHVKLSKLLNISRKIGLGETI